VIVGIFDSTKKYVIVYYEVAMECLRRKDGQPPVRRSLVTRLVQKLVSPVTTTTCNLFVIS
jgi:hypothetical protein